MNEFRIFVFSAIIFFGALFMVGCVEVGQTTGGVEVCTGDTTECGDNHDESDASTTTTTN
jgi:hypothetical protein